MEKGYYLGIDLGTSSVKAILADETGVCFKEKQAYAQVSLDGWRSAVRDVVRKLAAQAGRERILGVGLSSQVGTYITDDGHLIHWWESSGREELDWLRREVSQAEFLQEISMRHPDIISYPLPRLMYIKKTQPQCRRVIMPKEYLVELFTGNVVSDCFSYRGLYNFRKKELNTALRERLGLDQQLPPIVDPTERAGGVTWDAAAEFGLLPGTPVYAGMNDFFAGLLGMGVIRKGDTFDISGTSEHVGVISEALVDTDMVSGDYLEHYVTYGGTKSSGVSCDFALQQLSCEQMDYGRLLREKPPIFLPYLRGERAPIFDENARGVFFGIGDKTDRHSMAYGVLEGVVFSLYDIAQRLGMSREGRLICGGGSSGNRMMALLKAELFGKEILTAREPDTSALGAAMTAMVGAGVFTGYREAAAQMVAYEEPIRAAGEYREVLLQRFGIYRSVYENLKGNFREFARIKEN